MTARSFRRNVGRRNYKTMLSTLPLSVRAEGWESWEKKQMEHEDQDAREPPQETICDPSDSENSCLSVNDSPPSRRLKLDTLVYDMNYNQMVHLRGIKRKAQKGFHDVRRRKAGAKTSHLKDLVDDVSSVLSWQTHQTRETDGKFGRSDIH